MNGTWKTESRRPRSVAGSMITILFGIKEVSYHALGCPAIFLRDIRRPSKPRCVLESTDTQITSLSPRKNRSRSVRDWPGATGSALGWGMQSMTHGISRIGVALGYAYSGFPSRPRATIKATMCPEINRYENYAPVPKEGRKSKFQNRVSGVST